MPHYVLRGRRPRAHFPRSLAVRAAGTVVAAAAVFAAPSAAQAAASAPAPTAVPCSSSALVTAIRNANRAGAATLQLARGCNYVLTRAVAEDDGLPPVTGNITLIGGPGTQISHGRFAGLFRILEVSSGGALTLVDLTVANGQLAGVDGFDDEGGGIRNAGTLVLRHVRLTGNSNRDGFGGGLYVDAGARATISGSDLNGNSAGTGGAIFNIGDLTIDRSALTVNTASERGGGILNFLTGTVTLRFTLVAFNSPDNCSPQGTIAGCQN